MHRKPPLPGKRSRIIALFVSSVVAVIVPCAGQALYSFGDPTADEQLYLELINRARANPPAEGARLAATTDPNVLASYTGYAVDLALMQAEFNLIAATPPLVPHAALMTSARSHSAWMLANATQAHNEPTNTPFTRMTAAGYIWSTAGENIYAFSKSTWYGHAGLQVDWGTGGTGGMQLGRGHRANIHSSSMREIGIGVSSGTNGTVGPQLVTQDFGNRSSPPTFGTGVAYYDLNSNNFYDTGEGISGITVNVSGTTNYCTTAQGGGWVVPIPSTAATRTVTFSGLNMNQTANLTVPASTNAKADLKLTYSPPSITSSSSAFANIAHTITFNVVGGSSSYKWNRWTPSSAAAENCEATTNITSATTGAYSVLATTHQQGTKSFHLAMPTPVTQEIDLNGLYYGNTTPSLSFQSRLGVASTAQICKMQVKEEGGDWGDVYTQAGSGGVGEASFSLRTVSLSSMAGKAFRVRFLMVFTSGSYFNQTTDDKGWLIDAITFTNISALASNSLQTLATNSGSYTPVAAGTYLMSVAPVISGRDFPASYQTLTVAVPPPTTVSIAVSPASGAENSGTDMVFTLTRSGVTTSALTVNFSVGGTATNATDYTASGAASFTPSSGTATFPAGSATTSVTLTPMNDSLVENDETAVITLTSGMGYTVAAPSTATATIVNDDSSVSIAVSPASAAENSGTGMVFTFTRSGVITPALTVNFSVGGTATNTTDYTASGAASFTASSGTATFSAGSATTSVTLTARTDTATELSETALLTVIPGGTYTAGIPNAATATIIDSNINTSFAIWSTAFELETGLPPGTLSANPNADYDHDGRSNLVEYAFAASPTVANDPAPNMPSLQPSSTDLVLRYQIDTTRTNLTITPQACSALGNWKAPGVAGAPIGFVDSLISTTGNIVTREAKVPLTSGNPLFIRMRVTVP